jgi:hypothetical protein
VTYLWHGRQIGQWVTVIAYGCDESTLTEAAGFRTKRTGESRANRCMATRSKYYSTQPEDNCCRYLLTICISLLPVDATGITFSINGTPTVNQLTHRCRDRRMSQTTVYRTNESRYSAGTRTANLLVSRALDWVLFYPLWTRSAQWRPCCANSFNAVAVYQLGVRHIDFQQRISDNNHQSCPRKVTNFMELQSSYPTTTIERHGYVGWSHLESHCC